MVEILLECVVCGERRSVKSGEVPPEEHPACDACLGPMVPLSAEADDEE